MVFHCTLDPDYVVPNSRRFINRQDVLLADILFNETQGLLRCEQNDKALKKVTDHLLSFGAETPPQPDSQRKDRRVWLYVSVGVMIVGVVIILGILKGTNKI